MDDQIYNRIELPPRASNLVESMRDVGYSFDSAVADIIDNSITAGATEVSLRADIDREVPCVGILDNGSGMAAEELLDAMRPGSRNPRETRTDHDLGRFGLGLKTASFSQCRRLTVLTSRKGIRSCARWDLDLVAQEDAWCVDILNEYDDLPFADQLIGDGTLILWEKLDRMIPESGDQSRSAFNDAITLAKKHLALVFHRFLSGDEKGVRKVKIFINQLPVEPYDPFFQKHPATQIGPEEVFRLKDDFITIQAFTLPHRNRVSAEDWDRYAGADGYLKNQGVYLYREKRLIIHGTWFGVMRQSELTKLCRVRIDMPNTLDSEFKINVAKSFAQVPPQLKKHLKKLSESLGANSKRVFVSKGRKLVEEARLPFWQRRIKNGQITYLINEEHPLVEGFINELDDAGRRTLLMILNLASATLPIDSVFADSANDESELMAHQLSDEELEDSIASIVTALLRGRALESEQIRDMLLSTEPFSSRKKNTEKVLNKILDEI